MRKVTEGLQGPVERDDAHDRAASAGSRGEQGERRPARRTDGWVPSSGTISSTLLRLTATQGRRSDLDPNVRILSIAGVTVEAIRQPDHVVVIATYRGEPVFVGAIRPWRGGWQHRIGLRRDGAWLRIIGNTGREPVSAKHFGIWRDPADGRRGSAATTRVRAEGARP